MAFRMLGISVLLVLACVSYSHGQDIMLDGLAFTSWGEWGEVQVCSPGTYVYAVRLKVEFDQGTFSDDSALNAVDLICIGPTQKRPDAKNNASISQFQVITSTVGHKGVHGIILECPDPHFAVGFQLRSEPDQILDDTAANNFNLFCSDGATALNGYGMDWGDWTPPVACPRGLRVCAIQTLVEGPTDDDTTLNNVNIGCCV